MVFKTLNSVNFVVHHLIAHSCKVNTSSAVNGAPPALKGSTCDFCFLFLLPKGLIVQCFRFKLVHGTSAGVLIRVFNTNVEANPASFSSVFIL